jgi:NADPH-dependent 2,4-dienoyl-CoA reductase/sulfur reductase-like enzyme
VSERLVVIGGDAAGMASASQARRQDGSLEIVALERGHYTSYSACGIPYLVAGDVGSVQDLVARTPDEFRSQYRIDVRMRHEVTGVDLADRFLEVRDLDRARTIRMPFDQLLFGTGARPIRPDLPGISSPWVHGVQTLDDGERLLAAAKESRCRHVVVIGAGYIGLEMAEAFHRWGANVVMVDAGATPMSRTLDPDMGGRLTGVIEGLGVEVHLGERVLAFEDHHVVTDRGRHRADIAVLGLGVTPNSDLAAAAGVGLGARGAIGVDARQRTDVDGVWAAGDCADTYDLVARRRIHIALGTVANRSARVAGINIGGGYARFPGVVGTAITKVCGTEVARTGLTEAAAERAGFAFVVARIESTARSGYYPGAEPMTVKMLAERGTGRILGAQIVGGAGSAKRIDTVATVLHAGMTVEQVIDLDLAYAPPFSPVWDPVQVAARKAASLL